MNNPNSASHGPRAAATAEEIDLEISELSDRLNNLYSRAVELCGVAQVPAGPEFQPGDIGMIGRMRYWRDHLCEMNQRAQAAQERFNEAVG